MSDIRETFLRMTIDQFFEMVADFEVVKAQRDELVNQVREMREVFEEYIEHNGAVHYGGCPEDDTCQCRGKEINDRISNIFQATAKSVLAKVKGGE